MTILDPLRQWIVDRQGRRFSLATAVAELARPRLPILRALDILAREGYLVEVKDEPIPAKLGEHGPPRRNPTWKINKKMNVAKRPAVQNPRRNTMRDKMWRLIRAQRRFTRANLERLAGSSRGGVKDFTDLLEREHYIRRIGKDGADVLYLLVKDCGPSRPQIRESKEVANG